MDFIQRRTHLYKWLAITIILMAGFAYIAYMKWWQARILEGEIIENPWEEIQAIDSLYIQKWDTQFYLRSNENEKYLEAIVQSEVPMIALHVFENDSLIGMLEGKGYYVLRSNNDSIGELRLENMIKNAFE